MKERQYGPIICRHCGKESPSNGSKQKYHPECSLEVRIARHRERYQTIPEVRERVLRSNRPSWRRAHERKQEAKLIGLLDSLASSFPEPQELFSTDNGTVIISQDGLFMRIEQTHLPISPRDVVRNYTYKRIKHAVRKQI